MSEVRQNSEINLGDLGKLVELDANGAALTPATIERVEEMLKPLAVLVTHVDLVLRRVSIQHLRQPKAQHVSQEKER
jgi:hypothetical protein